MRKHRYLIIALLLLALAFVLTRVSAPTTLSVHFIDVGQGDSFLIQSSDGTTVLLDGGKNNGMALAYLQAQGIERLDAVIASHPDADHIGGLVQVMRAIPTRAVWTSGAAHTTRTYEDFLDVIGEQGIRYNEATTGQQIRIGSLQFEVLSADLSQSDLNNTSLVLRLQQGADSFLFTGDADVHIERSLVNELGPQRLQSSVLKLGHHGAQTSTSGLFLNVVMPDYAVYSAGQNNTYGHPHEVALERLEARSIPVYGTDHNGTIVFTTSGRGIDIETERGAALTRATNTEEAA